MHFDPTVAFLFGSTTSADRLNPGQSIYFFQVDLDSNQNPRVDNLILKKIDQTSVIWNKFWVMGLRPTLEGSKIHALIGNGGFINYAVIDLVGNSVTLTKLHQILPASLRDTNSVIHFMGSGVQSQDGLNLYESYTATGSSDYFNTVP